MMNWRPFILSLVFLLPGFSQVIVVSHYFINQNEYESNCVNKGRPSLDCHGKCKLQKDLNALDTDDSDENNLPSLPKIKEVAPYLIVGLIKIELSEITFQNFKFTDHQSKLIYTILDSVFQPPEIIS